MELTVDGYLAAFKTADVPAREETVVEFQHEFHAAGEHVVEVRLPRPPDGRQPALAERARRPPHERAARQRPRRRKPAQNASYYLATVLAPATSREAWSGPTLPKVISDADLAAEDLSRYDCVFLCNVPLVTPTEAALLQAYAEAGGGIVFTLGDRVKPENYNALLYRDGKGVLPERSKPERRGPCGEPSQKGYTFDAGDLAHPIVAPSGGIPTRAWSGPSHWNTSR